MLLFPSCVRWIPDSEAEVSAAMERRAQKLSWLNERNNFNNERNSENQRIQQGWQDLREARNQLEIERAEFEEASRYKPTNCRRVTFSGAGLLVFRSQPLTREEISALNSCTSWSTVGGGTRYEDLDRRDCQIKKRLDEESSIGYFRNGDIVDYIGRQGSWNEIVNIETGQRGFISARYGGSPTLVRASCN